MMSEPSYRNYLEESRTGETVAFLEFLRSVTPHSVHIFVEGESDIAFYQHCIKRCYMSDFELNFHVCGGKNLVYVTHSSIMNRKDTPEWYKSVTFLFFVDRDLSDFLDETENPSESDDIYVTEYYSFENYLVSDEMFVSVLNDLVSFPSGSRPHGESITTLLDKFHQGLELFYEFCQNIMAYGLYHKENRTKFRFKNLKIGSLIEFDEHLIPSFKCPTDIAELTLFLDSKCDVKLDDYSLIKHKRIVMKFSELHPKLFTRGKYELCFFQKFFFGLKKYFSANYSLRVSCRESLMSADNLVFTLSPRMNTLPKKLVEYLIERLRHSI
jgi:hypothetical protein